MKSIIYKYKSQNAFLLHFSTFSQPPLEPPVDTWRRLNVYKSLYDVKTT